MYAGAVPFVTPHIYVDMFVVTMFDRMLAKVCRWYINHILFTYMYVHNFTMAAWRLYVHTFLQHGAAFRWIHQRIRVLTYTKNIISSLVYARYKIGLICLVHSWVIMFILYGRLVGQVSDVEALKMFYFNNSIFVFPSCGLQI